MSLSPEEDTFATHPVSPAPTPSSDYRISQVYLAGPMTGYPDFNRATFNRVARDLRRRGLYVFNPAENDASLGLATNDTGDEHQAARDANLTTMQMNRLVMGMDLDWICKYADAVGVLDGWRKSAGARAEISLAVKLGLPIFFADAEIDPMMSFLRVHTDADFAFVPVNPGEDGSHLAPCRPCGIWHPIIILLGATAKDRQTFIKTTGITYLPNNVLPTHLHCGRTIAVNADNYLTINGWILPFDTRVVTDPQWSGRTRHENFDVRDYLRSRVRRGVVQPRFDVGWSFWGGRSWSLGGGRAADWWENRLERRDGQETR